MWPESAENNQPLRTGFTTGTCATACSVASALVLLGNDVPKVVSVTLPKGKTVELTVQLEQRTSEYARTSTIKDAGDDPDITHGATIWVTLTLLANPEIRFVAGRGVGTVTKAGLALAVGEPAINPVPRKMIVENLQRIAEQTQYNGGFEITVGVKNGEALALKTMNPRLGILGGLSILGTTGIVRPFSCAAWIASIHQAIDVAEANGLAHIAASTGNASETAVQQKYDLTETALIEMGDFVGAVLKHLRRSAVTQLSICGGFGKISKLANGHMDLHSRASSIDLTHLANLAKALGASADLQSRICQANTSIEALNVCQKAQIPLANAVCEAALTVCLDKIHRPIALEILAINRTGEIIGRAATMDFGEAL